MFERPDFTDPRFAEHEWYFNAYKDAIVPLCKGRVLDIGAGYGYLSRAAAERDAVVSVLATDCHFDQRRSQTHPKLTTLILGTEQLIRTKVDLEFETIIATEHIEHLDEMLHVPLLDFIARHLAPAGLFLGSMPNVQNSGNPFHRREYLGAEWLEVLLRHFEIVELWYPSPLLYVWRAERPR